MTDPKIKFDSVTKQYGSLVVLDNLCLEVDEEEVVSIIGPSGSGKTTVLRVLMALEGIQSGTIYVDGEPMNKMPLKGKLVKANKKHIKKIRLKLGMVFQQFNLFPHINVLENCIKAPIYSLGMKREDAIERASNLLSMVGMIEKRDHYPSQLSGGQQQRVAIARALAMQPQILLFDEPTSALDPETVGEVLEVIKSLALRYKYTMIMVTHQLGFAREISDRILFIEHGNIVEQGPPSSIFDNPQNERTKKFLNSILIAT